MPRDGGDPKNFMSKSRRILLLIPFQSIKGILSFNVKFSKL